MAAAASPARLQASSIEPCNHRSSTAMMTSTMKVASWIANALLTVPALALEAPGLALVPTPVLDLVPRVAGEDSPQLLRRQRPSRLASRLFLGAADVLLPEDDAQPPKIGSTFANLGSAALFHRMPLLRGASLYQDGSFLK
jgi:hypothetical protein